MNLPIEGAILLPLLGGALAFLLGRRAAPLVAVFTGAGNAVFAGWLAYLVWTHGPQRYALGGWEAPLGISLYADGLSALMVLMTALLMVILSVYASGYYAPGQGTPGGWRERDAFYPLWLFLLATLNALFLSADIFNLYVVLELLTLAGVGLVLLAGGPAALTSAMRYLLAAFLGSLLYLLGVTLIYAGFDALDMHVLRERVASDGPVWVAVALMTVGLMVKTALFPFHAWLPHAHSSAPAPVSALLSALVVKASFYLVLRLWGDVFVDTLNVPAAQAVGLLGAAGILWGSIQAIREDRLKLVVAHSTVAQVGYLFLVVPLFIVPDSASNPGIAVWRFDAWAGGIYHILSHAFAKASLFLGAGTVLYALGTDRLTALRGLAVRMPITTFTFGIAGIALIGLPPSGSFIAKWLMLNSALGSGQWWWVVVIGAGTLLSGGYVFKIMRLAFASPEEGAERSPVPRQMELAGLALALVALTLGLRSAEPLALMEIGAPFILITPGTG
jgi:multicomponent Na+:H+ antiporter subunit D